MEYPPLQAFQVENGDLLPLDGDQSLVGEGAEHFVHARASGGHTGDQLGLGQAQVKLGVVLSSSVAARKALEGAGVESGPAVEYNVVAVRDLLLAGFTADDLRRLVLYTSRPALRPLIHEFGSGDGLSAIVEKTVTYCQKQDCIPDLLAEVKEANPRQYANYEDGLLP